MRKLRSYFSVTLLVIYMLIVPALASAETCQEAYDDGFYEEAIHLCLEEKKYDPLARSYGKLDDCINYEKYNRLIARPYALGNIGLSFLQGWHGCEVNKVKAVKLLEGVIQNRKAYAAFLGDHYRIIGRTEPAKKYYRIALDQTETMEWDAAQAGRSLKQLLALYNNTEKESLYLEVVSNDYNSTDWQKELTTKAIVGLQSILSTGEMLEFALEKAPANASYKCEMGERLYRTDFQGLIFELKKQNKTNAFITYLCKGEKEYFLGKTFENGLGNKEDLQEAYRLYLMAGANGNEYAKAARDRIRGQLTPKQIQEAVCLADYGIEPSYFNKVRCKF